MSSFTFVQSFFSNFHSFECAIFFSIREIPDSLAPIHARNLPTALIVVRVDGRSDFDVSVVQINEFIHHTSVGVVQ